MSTLLRIDFMFSGTFLEDADAEFVSTMLRSPKLIRFDFNEDMMNEDLTMNLQDHGLENEQIEWVSSEHACFIDPTELDELTSKKTGVPRFRQGARATRFLHLEAEASEELIMAVHNACVMASVTLSVEDRAVYDDTPQVAVNPIALVGESVDVRSPHARRADALVAAINAALASHSDR